MNKTKKKAIKCKGRSNLTEWKFCDLLYFSQVSKLEYQKMEDFITQNSHFQLVSFFQNGKNVAEDPLNPNIFVKLNTLFIQCPCIISTKLCGVFYSCSGTVWKSDRLQILGPGTKRTCHCQ